MAFTAQELLDSLHADLADQIYLIREASVGEIIATPYLIHNNDCLEVYLDTKNSLLTDDGETLRELKLAGVDITDEFVKEEINLILQGLGAQLEDNAEIVAHYCDDDFGYMFNSFIQALLAIDALYVIAKYSLYIKNKPKNVTNSIY
jgi:hypothetical protein